MANPALGPHVGSEMKLVSNAMRLRARPGRRISEARFQFSASPESRDEALGVGRGTGDPRYDLASKPSLVNSSVGCALHEGCLLNLEGQGMDPRWPGLGCARGYRSCMDAILQVGTRILTEY